MRRASILVALLGLAACASTPPPAAVAPPALPPAFERAHLAECAEASANIAKANDILARRGSEVRVDLDRTPCTAPTPDSGARYVKPRPRPAVVDCRSYGVRGARWRCTVD